MEIQELRSYTAEDLRDMDELMHQLSASSCCTEEKLRAVVKDENSHLYVVREQAPLVSEGSRGSRSSRGSMVQEVQWFK